MQVIGLCRFSYPAIGGFQVEHDSIQERMEYLYASERMASRFATFEAFTLPCLRAQSDPDFTFLIVTGDDMPEPFADRLNDLTADLPQVVVQRHAPGKHRGVMKEAINSVRAPSDDPCLQFRLDDDDAVSVEFVKSLRKQAERAYPLFHGNRHLALDFTQGHIARPGPKGIEAMPIKNRHWAPGLTLMLSPQTDVTVMNYSHHKVWQKMTTVTFTGEDMMLRGRTEFNDSRQKGAARDGDLTLLDAAGESHFKATYNIDADDVRQLFSPTAAQAAFAVEGE